MRRHIGDQRRGSPQKNIKGSDFGAESIFRQFSFLITVHPEFLHRPSNSFTTAKIESSSMPIDASDEKKNNPIIHMHNGIGCKQLLDLAHRFVQTNMANLFRKNEWHIYNSEVEIDKQPSKECWSIIGNGTQN